MSSVFEKLNLKQQQEILVVNAPASFEPELLTLKGVTVLRDPKKAKAIHFALVFATRQTEVDALSKLLAGKAEDSKVTRCCGSRTLKERPSGTGASSIAIRGGAKCGVPASTRCAKSP